MPFTKRAILAGVIALLPLFCGVSSTSAEEPIAVIASGGWTELQQVSLATLRRVYLGKVTRLAGARVERFHLAAGSEVRERFSLAVLGRSDAELEDYWLEQALTGGPPPPREVASEQELIERLAEDAHAIGYIGYQSLKGVDSESVRVLPLVQGGRRLTPDQPGYPIRDSAPSPGQGGTGTKR